MPVCLFLSATATVLRNIWSLSVNYSILIVLAFVMLWQTPRAVFFFFVFWLVVWKTVANNVEEDVAAEARGLSRWNRSQGTEKCSVVFHTPMGDGVVSSPRIPASYSLEPNIWKGSFHAHDVRSFHGLHHKQGCLCVWCVYVVCLFVYGMGMLFECVYLSVCECICAFVWWICVFV